jgi:hypothetical protein
MPDDALVELFHAGWVSGLRSLDLWTSPWRRARAPDAVALLLQRDTPQLNEVGLRGADALPRRQLAAWPVLPRLTRFDAGGDAAFTAWLLAKVPLTPRVPRLDLNERCDSVAAVRALAASRWAGGLCHLGFGYNGLTRKKVARLAAALFARHLEALHLGSERGEEEGLAALRIIADERHFPRLRDVVVGSDTVEGGIDVLRRRFGPRLRVWADC